MSIPDPPADVTAAGYVRTSFFDDFDDTSSIDMTNSGDPGFKWYCKSNWPSVGWNTGRPDFDPSTISVVDSVLHNGSITANNLYGLVSACDNGVAGDFNGYSFRNGAYFECSMAFDPTLAHGTGSGWPAFWLHGMNLFLHEGVTDVSELDVFEAYPASTGTVSTLMSLHEWNIPSGQSRDSTNNSVVLPGNPTLDLTHFHRYGALWIPMSKNGGTGLLKRYFDGVHIPSADLSYTATTDSTPTSTGANPPSPTGAFSVLDDADGMCLLLGVVDSTNPAYFDWVRVIQPQNQTMKVTL